METANIGEEFEIRFTIKDARDSTRTVDSASFEITLDGETIDSGDMEIDDAGRVASFRFIASDVGFHHIKVAWRMGSDVWRKTFLINVVDP